MIFTDSKAETPAKKTAATPNRSVRRNAIAQDRNTAEQCYRKRRKKNRGEAEEEDGPIVHSTFDCGERKICGVDIYTGW